MTKRIKTPILTHSTKQATPVPTPVQILLVEVSHAEPPQRPQAKPPAIGEVTFESAIQAGKRSCCKNIATPKNSQAEKENDDDDRNRT